MSYVTLTPRADRAKGRSGYPRPAAPQDLRAVQGERRAAGVAPCSHPRRPPASSPEARQEGSSHPRQICAEVRSEFGSGQAHGARARTRDASLCSRARHARDAGEGLHEAGPLSARLSTSPSCWLRTTRNVNQASGGLPFDEESSPAADCFPCAARVEEQGLQYLRWKSGSSAKANEYHLRLAGRRLVMVTMSCTRIVNNQQGTLRLEGRRRKEGKGGFIASPLGKLMAKATLPAAHPRLGQRLRADSIERTRKNKSPNMKETKDLPDKISRGSISPRRWD